MPNDCTTFLNKDENCGLFLLSLISGTLWLNKDTIYRTFAEPDWLLPIENLISPSESLNQVLVGSRYSCHAEVCLYHVYTIMKMMSCKRDFKLCDWSNTCYGYGGRFKFVTIKFAYQLQVF